MPQDLRKGGRGASARAAGAPLTLLEGRQSWSWMVRVQTSRRARCLDWDRHMGRSRLRLHTGLSGASAASGDWARRGLNRTQIEHKSRSSLVPANQKDAGLQVISLVGETGFEPATARPPAGCATRLRHSPWQTKRATGIEPALEAWKASVQPQHFARTPCGHLTGAPRWAPHRTRRPGPPAATGRPSCRVRRPA